MDLWFKNNGSGGRTGVSSLFSMLNLRQLRKEIRQQRRALSLQTHQQLSAQICSNLLQLPQLRFARSVGCYLSNDGEPNLMALMQHLWHRNGAVYLPQLFPRKRQHKLWFAPYTPETALYNNCYGIAEPESAPLLPRQFAKIDIMLLPLVGFTAKGTRLGMGGGYYDRTFARYVDAKRWRQPKLIGVAFELQKVANLPKNSWDVEVDMIVTESAIYR